MRIVCAALLMLVGAVRAELVEVPPEVAVHAYRRLVFALNLNPVPWALVRKEASALGTALPLPHAARLAAALKGQLDEPGRIEDRALDRQGRRVAARAVFEAATRAAGQLMLLRIQEQRAGRGEGVRTTWGLFEPEVSVTDPAAAARLKDLPLDALETYVAASWGEAYAAPASGRLAPLPAGSPTFNRATAAPRVLPPGSVTSKQVPRPRQVLNFAARGASEHDTPLVALGDMAFDSPFLFGEPARSARIACSTCHNKGTVNPNLFVPGLSERAGGMDVSNAFFAPHANDALAGHLDTPDMRGIRFTAPYGRNGRFPSLREFTRNVIVNEFNGAEPDPLILDALVAYFNEFDFLPNPLIKSDGTLADRASVAARRGERLFAKHCASCHVPADHFLDRKRHDVGTVPGAGAGSLDRALDTPTLLSSKFTAPYMHDGSLPTLKAVVEYFDRFLKLKLNAGQIADLTAYLEAVGDGTDPYEPDAHFLAAEMEELSFFLSGYEYLKEQAKLDLIGLLFQTVAGEVRAHVTNLQDARQAPRMERLAVLMDEARAAVQRGDAALMDAKVAEWRRAYDESKGVLK